MADTTAQGQFEALHRLQDAAIAAARTSGPPNYSGDGMVIVAGGGRYFVNAFVALTVLRNDVACQLPIQIWYLGPHEMSDAMKALLTPFDVELVDASQVRRRRPVRKLGGWECKPYAIINSPFERVILLDADNVPLQNPQVLLGLQKLETNSALFWPDISDAQSDSPVWELFRIPYQSEPEVESGQVVVDKSRAWLALHLAMHYCEWSDIYWQYINGDKQAFQMAWRFLGEPYALCPWPARKLLGTVETPHGKQRYAVAFEQHDFSGNPMFHHRVGAEWVLYGRNIRVESAVTLERRCHSILDHLRQQWDGRIAQIATHNDFVTPPDLSAGGKFHYRRMGIEEREIELLPDGSIGLGKSCNESGWRLEPSGDQQEIVITRADTDICRLSHDDDGTWRGHWLYYEQNPVELIPVQTGEQS